LSNPDAAHCPLGNSFAVIPLGKELRHCAKQKDMPAKLPQDYVT